MFIRSQLNPMAYVNAVNSGKKNVEQILLSPESKLQLVPLGPKLIKQTVNKHKTVDTEDTELKYIRQADGTLVTEKKKTTEHEDILDKDLPPDDDNQSSGSQEKILKHKESSQHFKKQRDEQEVEYVSDGKVIAKEMRYATENQFMERDGSKEEETDWDSLSDRVKKSRRQLQKTLLQKQRESNAINERKDALTNRPLDFDREEETRRKETYKWLDSHFGSESTSKDSRDESISDIVVEPTKKSYFNVTIKSNNHHNVTHTSSSSSLNNNINSNNNNQNNKITSIAHRQTNSTTKLSTDNDVFTNKLSAPSKVYVPEREPAPTKQKYFQGVSDWSERKESPPRPLRANPLSSKAFQEELSNTIERKQRSMKLQGSQNDIRLSGKKFEEFKPTNGRQMSSRDDVQRLQKEDLGYLSGSRTDLRVPRKYSNDDYAVPIKKKTNGLLHREDSGFRDSKEDVRSPPQREDSFGHDDVKQTSIQRDDSAYVSSSTYFTTPRSPRRPRSPVIKTPDSGIRSPDNDFESDEIHQPPAVPQRKKAIERKIRVPTKNEDYANYPAKPRRDPPIDYSPPPPRSRSVSPLPPIHHVYSDRKSYQKTRFSSPPSTPTVPRATQTSPPKKKTVGNAIGNSLRKLVGKIRSVSAERKLKAKPSSGISSKQSPSPLPMTRHRSVSHLPSTSSYQRNDYVIDGHITGNNYKNRPQSTSTQASTTHIRRERTLDHIERSGSSTTDNEMPINERTVTTHHQKKTMITSPKQRYYLGENPYGGSIFGKENKYQNGVPRDSEIVKHKNYYNSSQVHPPARRLRSEEPTFGSNVNSLGRFSKSTNRLTTNGTSTQTKNGFSSSAALNESNENYRNSQTLPRKLDHHKQKPISQSTINVSIVNNVKNHPVQNTGPAKPARTYKALQRSKSFNVHGMNGTNDPSPIYMEKLTNNNYKNYSNGHHKEPDSRTLHGEEEMTQKNIKFTERESSGSKGSSRSSPIVGKDSPIGILRRGSNSTDNDNYSETYKYQTKSNDPLNPTVTDTVETFSKKVIPTEIDPRTKKETTIERHEIKKVTTSRNFGTPSPTHVPSLKYYDVNHNKNGNGGVDETIGVVDPTLREIWDEHLVRF
ncbi:CLUMA_CG005858, isoform A [Clunio marinus]|uniref:CLUMA_CG005858, isoform A n=1 Tax=Clunio marinus TaxID=568069 RepID=A0A1J1I0F8_9DIPT|nr:CLUMA_CG005858, isoform A [Clunio marinus]